MWHEFWQLLSHGFYRNEADRGLAAVTVEIYFTFTMALQKSLGLSDDDIAGVALITYVDHENAIFPEILDAKVSRLIPNIRSPC